MTDSLVVAVEMDGKAVDVGSAYFSRRRRLTTSLRYDDRYLRRTDAYSIDPALGLYSGAQQTDGLPGCFADCSPDRWGKNLIMKRVQAEALRDGHAPASLSEVDFLTGVSDFARQGALRFRAADDAPFLDPESTIPKVVELPRLVRAADVVTRDGGDDMTTIKALLDAGSGSLGGARPKASVRDGDRLLIAKFPHRSDEWDVMAWEKTALDLAARAGIDVPNRELVDIDGRSVLILERFDREAGRRIGYISAMTLVQGADGDAQDYVDVAETLPEHGSRTSSDLRELWRRIAYSVVIHNTDDHLRNHGFLRDGPRGWTLSPAFDVNPNPNVAEQRATGIGGARSRADELTGLLTYAGTFDLDDSEAKTMLAEVGDATRDWRGVARANGIGQAEQDRFERAFEDLGDSVERVIAAGRAGPTGQPRSASGRFAPNR